MVNELVFATINSYAGHSVWLDRVGIFLAIYLTYLMVMAVIYGGFLTGWKYGRRMFWEAISSAIIGRYVIVEIIRMFFASPRPFAVEHVNQLIPESGWSFPSGHTTFLFALAMAVWFYNRRLSYWLFGGALLVGIARIYVGVHWPLDIVGGIVIGVATTVVWHQLVKIYLKRKAHTRT